MWVGLAVAILGLLAVGSVAWRVHGMVKAYGAAGGPPWER